MNAKKYKENFSITLVITTAFMLGFTLIGLISPLLTYAQETTGQITKGTIVQGDVTSANLTNGVINTNTINNGELVGANITGATINNADIIIVQNGTSTFQNESKPSVAQIDEGKINSAAITSGIMINGEVTDGRVSEGKMIGVNISGADIVSAELNGANINEIKLKTAGNAISGYETDVNPASGPLENDDFLNTTEAEEVNTNIDQALAELNPFN